MRVSIATIHALCEVRRPFSITETARLDITPADVAPCVCGACEPGAGLGLSNKSPADLLREAAHLGRKATRLAAERDPRATHPCSPTQKVAVTGVPLLGIALVGLTWAVDATRSRRRFAATGEPMFA